MIQGEFKHYACIILEMDDMDKIIKAIENEHKTSRSDRSKCFWIRRGNKLMLKIYGKDRSSFIATISSYLRWIKIYNDISDVLEMKKINIIKNNKKKRS